MHAPTCSSARPQPHPQQPLPQQSPSTYPHAASESADATRTTTRNHQYRAAPTTQRRSPKRSPVTTPEMAAHRHLLVSQHISLELVEPAHQLIHPPTRRTTNRRHNRNDDRRPPHRRRTNQSNRVRQRRARQRDTTRQLNRPPGQMVTPQHTSQRHTSRRRKRPRPHQRNRHRYQVRNRPRHLTGRSKNGTHYRERRQQANSVRRPAEPSTIRHNAPQNQDQKDTAFRATKFVHGDGEAKFPIVPDVNGTTSMRPFVM